MPAPVLEHFHLLCDDDLPTKTVIDTVGSFNATSFRDTELMSVPGIFGSAFKLNGTTDFLDVPNGAVTSAFTGLSMFMWLKANDWESMVASQEIVVSIARGGVDDIRWAFNTVTTSDISVQFDDGVVDPSVVVPHGLTGNENALVGFSYDGTTLIVYVNAVEVGRDTGDFTFANTVDFTIGKRSLGVPRHFNGDVKDIRLFDFPVLVTDPPLIYNNGFGTSQGLGALRQAAGGRAMFRGVGKGYYRGVG